MPTTVPINVAVVARRAVFVLAAAVLGSGCGWGSGDRGVQVADWWLSAAPSGIEVPVVVYTGSSSCNEFDRVEVDESSDEVVITAYVNRVGGPDCTADYNSQPAPVRLASPLGTRTLTGCGAPEGGLHAHGLPRDNVDCSLRGG